MAYSARSAAKVRFVLPKHARMVCGAWNEGYVVIIVIIIICIIIISPICVEVRLVEFCFPVC